jgi:hypothetical protein
LGPGQSGSVSGSLELGTSYVKVADVHSQGYAAQQNHQHHSDHDYDRSLALAAKEEARGCIVNVHIAPTFLVRTDCISAAIRIALHGLYEKFNM